MNTESKAQPDDPLFGNSLSGLLGAAMETAQPDSQAVPDKWEPPSPEHIAVLLPQYRIEHLIGRGGMGAVYKGRQITLNRPVAIKVLPAELARNREFVARFHREAQLLASLSHQGVVTIFDFGQTTEGHLYFIMEYVDGTDLHRLIHKSKLDAEQALKLTIQICEALQYAHDMGVIHRDIKPANVLVTRDGRAKLADFGLAMKPADHAVEAPTPVLPDDFDPTDPLGIKALRITKPGTAMGTPDYAAPEVYDGRADSRSDIYALGIMLYEMLTGAPPKGYYQLPSSKAKVDARIDRVIVKALDPDPSARYQKASDMRLEVENATKPLPAKAPAPPMRSPDATRQQKPPAGSPGKRAAPQSAAAAQAASVPGQKSRFALHFFTFAFIALSAGGAYDSQHGWHWTRLICRMTGITLPAGMERAATSPAAVVAEKTGSITPSPVNREGDPLVGKWWWPNDMQSMFAPDGTFARSDGGTGTWEENTAAGTSARSYLLKWRDASTTRFTLRPGYVELEAKSSGKPDAVLCKIPLHPSPPSDETPQPLEPGYVSLFDRDHISGWTHVGAGSFDIVKGTYVTSTPVGEYQPWGLFWYTAKTFSDFVLKVDFAVDAAYTNSGLYFRLPKLGSGKPNLFIDSAYEAEIRGEETGMLTGVSERRKFPLPLRKWNTMEITAIGQTITVAVNGQTMSEIIGTRNLSGYIALQNLGCCGSAYFRNVRIKEIGTEVSQAKADAPKPREAAPVDFDEMRRDGLTWLRAAKTIAPQISDDQSRQWSLRDLAPAFARFGEHDEAISTAKSIADRAVQGRVFMAIALAQAQQNDIERAVASAALAPDPADVDRALAGIIGELMSKGDKTRAERVATRLTGANGKARYLVELALEANAKRERATYQKYIEEARQLAVTLKEQADLKDAFRAIVMAEVKAGDVDSAKKTAQLYKGHRFGTPLIDIVEAQAENGDFKGAHASFNAAGFTMYPACLALARIADAEANAGDFEAARRSAGRLWYSDHKLKSQNSVELRAGNLTLARRAADGLLTCDHLDGNRADVHARALGRTAALQAEKEGVPTTLQWINGLSSAGARVRAYLSLAEYQLTRLPPPGPRTFTDTNGSKIEATLISIKDNEVTLKLRNDGRIYVLPTKRFSSTDIDFFHSLTKAR